MKMPDMAMPSYENSAAAMSQPLLRETMTIMVSGKPVVKYRDEIERQLCDARLYSILGLRGSSGV